MIHEEYGALTLHDFSSLLGITIKHWLGVEKLVVKMHEQVLRLVVDVS